MITIPTIAELRDQILADIETVTGQSAPLLPRAVWRVLATALGGALHLLYRFGAWAYKQIFTLTADEEGLRRRATEYGISRIPATKWIGTATATGDDDTIISSGTLFQADGYVYEVQSSVTISGGSATMTLESLETGEDVDLSVSDTIKIVSPQAGVDDEATVASVTQAGEDAEDIEVFRDRILFQQQNQPQGGAVADYVKWAREVAGIAEAYAFQPDDGFVNIYPLLDVDDPADRIPDSSKLTEVENYVNDTRRRPLNANVNAVAFTELNFDVDIADLDPSDADTKSAIETAIENYMYERRPKQYDDEPNPKNVISEAKITQVAVAAGASVATVDLKNAGGSSITDYELDDDELAVLRTLSWV